LLVVHQSCQQQVVWPLPLLTDMSTDWAEDQHSK